MGNCEKRYYGKAIYAKNAARCLGYRNPANPLMVYTGVDESGYTTAMLSIRKCLKGIQLTVKFKAYLF